MPVYEYGCTSCNARFEIMQRFSDPPLETCEKCGAPVKKLISNTSFVLKGSGWYLTDYARSNTPASAPGGDSSSSDASKSESKGETKTESKAETKSESKSESSSSSTPSSTASTP